MKILHSGRSLSEHELMTRLLGMYPLRAKRVPIQGLHGSLKSDFHPDPQGTRTLRVADPLPQTPLTEKTTEGTPFLHFLLLNSNHERLQPHPLPCPALWTLGEMPHTANGVNAGLPPYQPRNVGTPTPMLPICSTNYRKDSKCKEIE